MKILFDVNDELGARIWRALPSGATEADFREFVRRAKQEVVAFVELAEKTRLEPRVWTGR